MGPQNSSNNPPRQLLLLVAFLAWANSNALAQSPRGNPSQNNGPWPYDHLPAYVPKVADPRLSEPLTFGKPGGKAPVANREAIRVADPAALSPEDDVKKQQWPPAFPNSRQPFSGPFSSAFQPDEEQPVYGPTYMYTGANSNPQEGRQQDDEDSGINEDRNLERYPEQAFQWRRFSP